MFKKKYPVIIDTDPGVDDALSLITMLRARKRFDIKLMCSVSGNVKIGITTNNMLHLLENFNPHIPAAEGEEGPRIKGKQVDASNVHGVGGLGAYQIPKVYEKTVDFNSALEGYVKVLSEAKKPIYLLTLGPLTNVATLVKTHPELLCKIKRVYSMIGSYNGAGNAHKGSYSEFNTYCDTKALDTVINSGLHVVFLPMELGHDTKIAKSEFAKVEVTNPAINMIKQMVLGVNETVVDNDYFAVYDLHVPAAISCPNLYKFKRCTATVNTNENDERFGQVFLTPNKHGNHSVVYIKNTKKLANKIFKELYQGIL